jgi:MFS family permease
MDDSQGSAIQGTRMSRHWRCLGSIAGWYSVEKKPWCKYLQGDFDLSTFQDGCLPAAFMVGLMAASPAFAALTKTVQPFTLLGVGLLIWTLSVAACALSWDFWSLLACRMLVGVGEASFVVLAAPFIGAHGPLVAVGGMSK